jgi:PAS domain S-box-containing protein
MMPDPIRVLLVEDSPSDAELLQESLAQSDPGGFNFNHVETWAKAREQLGRGTFDVLLLDLTLPDTAGRETFLRARAEAPHLPIVVLTGVEDEIVSLESVRHGIQAYLIKSETHGRPTAREIRYAIERKKSEDRIRLQARMLDAVGQAVIAIDLHQSITYWNQTAAALFGVSREEALGRNLREVTCPQATREQEAEIMQALSRHETWSGEILFSLKDGTRLPLLTVNSPFFDERGELAGIIGVGADLTEHKRAEEAIRRAHQELELRVQERTADLRQTVTALQAEITQREAAEQALRESEERYRKLFESAPVGIAMSNQQGKVIAFNRRLCAMAGVTSTEAQATPAANFYAKPSQRRQLLARLWRFGKVEAGEAILKRADGSTLLGLLQMEKIRLGREDVVMTLVEDISRQKQTERHVKGVRELLELFAIKSTRKDYIKSVVKMLRDWCGCQCAGIRLLDEQERLPYVASVGYSRQFLKQEGRLCFGKDDCACVRAFSGKARPADLPFISHNGSFFCNSATASTVHLCAGPSDYAKVACIAAGYNSLAHAPIRYHGRLLGTIHLADSRCDRFPPETISFIETVAPLIGEAIHRFQVEESLQESEQRFRSMFERHAAIMLLVEPGSGTIEAANPAAAAFYGHSVERLRTMKLEELQTLAPSVVAGQIRRALRGEQKGFVSTHRLAGGEVRTVEIHSSPVGIKSSVSLFLIIHDVTERRLLEQQVLDIGEQERQRLGRDLHDSLGGKLTGAALISGALAKQLTRNQRPEAELAEEVVQCINESIGHTRAIARGLCPVELTTSGLAGGLAELALQTQRLTGVGCRFEHDPQAEVRDLFVATHLYRLTQEAVSNALRHGDARHVTIRLATAGDHLSLDIRDDGAGLPSKPPATGGLGMRTMKYRANLVGAELKIKSGESGGTVVSCLLPVNSAGNLVT